MERKFNVWKVEVGVLLTPENEEYSSYKVDTVYGGKFSFYDENVAFFLDKEEAIKYAKQYCQDGVERTYGIVSEFIYDGDTLCADDDEIQEIIDSIKNNGCIEFYEYIFDCYDLHNVIELYVKIAGNTQKLCLD